jgi:hypothetical protein
MKRIALILAIISNIVCTKEKKPDSLVGTWTLTEIHSGNISSILLSGTELSVRFNRDSSFDILGPKPNYTFLQSFNRYETLGNDRIRFFSTNSDEELFAGFRLNTTLSISYEVRCPYEEKFIRR